jgi:anti-sigma regulatory factor (Ser/Thr protein kinase)
VEEIFVNIADYAYGEKAVDLCYSKPVSERSERLTTAAQCVIVTCITNNVTYITKNREMVSVTFADRGIPFNPLTVPEPNLNVPPEERKNGGFGIFMVKNLMDVIEYEREDGWNKLTIGKHIKHIRRK